MLAEMDLKVVEGGSATIIWNEIKQHVDCLLREYEMINP